MACLFSTSFVALWFSCVKGTYLIDLAALRFNPLSGHL